MKPMCTKMFAIVLMAVCVVGCRSTQENDDSALRDRRVSVSYGTVETLFFDQTPLHRAVAVDVWLPEGYLTTDEAYPVCYMHDGQNCLDATTTWNGQSWEIDEAMDSLSKLPDFQMPLVVCIYSNEDRMRELMPADYKTYTTLWNRLRHPIMGHFIRYAGSDEYLSFVCDSLKPFIDTHYRTLSDRKHTAVMGSSMGALMSLYAVQQRPDIFGTAMGLSFPAFKGMWDIQKKAIQSARLDSVRLYFDNGTEDLDATFFPMFDELEDLLKAQGCEESDLSVQVFEGKGHNEDAWSQRVVIPLSFAFGY